MTKAADMGGDIRVSLAVAEGRVSAVAIRSTRPIEAARIFEGGSPEALCTRIGRVFSLCGAAQTVAALGAVEQALGLTREPAVHAARRALRQAEMLTQIVTRLALHWPGALGLALQPEAVRAAMATQRAIEAQVLGAGWRAPGAGTSGTGEAVEVALVDIAGLTAPLTDALTARDEAGFGALPHGMPPECGVLQTCWDAPAVAAVRQGHGAGLAARLAAAAAALEHLPEAIRADLALAGPASATRPQRASGQGVCTVETARGPLTHRVRIEAGVVTRCRTEAPTERNFTPDGPVGAGLVGERADLTAARLHVLAIDPCVAVDVDLAPAATG